MITDQAAKFATHIGSVALVFVIAYAGVVAAQFAGRRHPMMWLSVAGAILLAAGIVLIPDYSTGGTVSVLAGIALGIFGVSLDLLSPQPAPPASADTDRLDHRFE